MKQIILHITPDQQHALYLAVRMLSSNPYALYLFYVGLLTLYGHPVPDAIPIVEQDKEDKRKWTFTCY